MRYDQQRYQKFLEANPDIAAEVKAEKTQAVIEAAQYFVKLLFIRHRGNTDAIKGELRTFDMSDVSEGVKGAVMAAMNDQYQWHVSSPARMALCKSCAL